MSIAEEVGCLLCLVDEEIPEGPPRCMAYMAVADMAARAAKVPWQQYTNVCRTHAMVHVDAMVKMNDVMVQLMLDYRPPDIEEAEVQAVGKMLRKHIAGLEEVVIAKYDAETK